ncbi:hypothetical protein [Polaribacter cellanae]|uniref:Uncharacterized protein n=1 Tax=Polaribacter cellanae TaxID=2818493 RepID=A0A975H6G1_9FLAO|nr:hypothetical protein [Polaribacter cellanae]QTE22397.1 hypothetical protein J3359_16590 [Polaribacter cellanae]
MNCKITFPSTDVHSEIYFLRKITSVHIEKSWKRLTDIAVITLPRKNASVKNQNGTDFSFFGVYKLIRKGDPVIIELGYNGVLNKEFIGYVTEVIDGVPLVIKCEDEMYHLKRTPVNIALPKITLEKLLKTILPKYEIEALEIEIPPVRFPKTTVAQVLEYLKTEYSLYSYMKARTLVCGKIYADDFEVETVNLHLEKNIVNEDLNYTTKEDILIRINAVSKLSNGNTVKVIVGDKNGVEKQLSYYGIEVEAELEKLAILDLKKYKVNKFTGSITCFGSPKIEHGMKVQLQSEVYPDRVGLYYVESTVIDYSESGFRRKVNLGEKVVT